jgi:hypothetical protein
MPPISWSNISYYDKPVSGEHYMMFHVHSLCSIGYAAKDKVKRMIVFLPCTDSSFDLEIQGPASE